MVHFAIGDGNRYDTDRKPNMKRAMFALAAGLMLPCAAIPQDLPPGVLLLSRIQRHIRQELERLPDISCLETVRREHKEPNGKLRPLDTVRLEVLSTGNQELFASPGDRKFSDRPPISFAGSGALGDGFFGLYLKSVLLNNNATHVYKGEEEIAGRRLARWDYRLPVMWSGQTIQLPEGAGRVGLRGAFWADPQTLDVVRLELNADDFPPTLPLTEAVWSIDYARTALEGHTAVLLPRSGGFRMAGFSGELNTNAIEFTQCRVFAAESAIRFNDPGAVPDTPAFGTASVDETLRPLPAGLKIAVRLRTRISAGMAVGELIEGTVESNVQPKGALLIAAGSPVRGRIRRLERDTDPIPHYVVGLEFTEVEVQGIRHRFHAELTGVDSAPGVELRLTVTTRTEEVNPAQGPGQVRTTTEVLTLPDLPGVGTFFVKGRDLDLPPGFRTEWKTRAPER